MRRPAVLTFSGLDPTGGAGLAADIRAMAQGGAHCLPVATAITVQDTRRAYGWEPVAPELVHRQVRVLLADIKPHAIKIGMVPTAALIGVIAEICAGQPGLPVVADPVLRAGGGGALSDPDLGAAWHRQLLPRVTLATPNREESGLLFPDGPTGLAPGQWLLVTDGDGGHDPITHELIDHAGHVQQLESRRLPGAFHGSGCTLAAATAARLAHGEDVKSAVRSALEQVAGSLSAAFPLGEGQWIPA